MLSVIISVLGESELIRWFGILKQSFNEQSYNLRYFGSNVFKTLLVYHLLLSVNVSYPASRPEYVNELKSREIGTLQSGSDHLVKRGARNLNSLHLAWGKMK